MVYRYEAWLEVSGVKSMIKYEIRLNFRNSQPKFAKKREKKLKKIQKLEGISAWDCG